MQVSFTWLLLRPQNTSLKPVRLLKLEDFLSHVLNTDFLEPQCVIKKNLKNLSNIVIKSLQLSS